MKDFGDERLKRMLENRPHCPKRAVLTGGMPYGNKDLHYGHVLGMFLYADFMARFLRDRIGKDNVIFVSGTDCYGSPALETYRKKCEEGYTGTISDMVEEFHERHVNDLNKFEISLNYFGASGVGDAVPFHNETSAEFFEKLYKYGYLKKMSTLQFYDEDKKTFLNGRQVLGKCPYEGCQSEKGYADECDLGHQYMPQELIDPISTLSGKKPVLKEITNWYFDMPRCLPLLTEWLDKMEKTELRPFVVKEIKLCIMFLPVNAYHHNVGNTVKTEEFIIGKVLIFLRYLVCMNIVIFNPDFYPPPRNSEGNVSISPNLNFQSSGVNFPIPLAG